MYNPFPLKFEERVNQDSFLGQSLLDSLNTEAPVSVRLNPQKKVELPNVSHAVPWCGDGLYLTKRPQFTLDPAFHAGAYYPQEAGSMILSYLLSELPIPEAPNVLDLCAAPGGKSTLIASFLRNRGLLVANEVIHQRAKILTENLSKWGFSNTIVTSNDPSDFRRLHDFFDLVVVDAPCSGEGMFRKDPKTRSEWSEENVKICAARQRRILKDAWKTLQPGGLLIYSTCTFNATENEENVDWFLNETESELIRMNITYGVTKGRNGIGNYCIPGKNETEGFYFVVIQKRNDSITKIRLNKNKDFRTYQVNHELAQYMNQEEHELFNWRDSIFALPYEQAERMLHIQAQLRLLKMGTMIGKQNRKDFVPGEELAMNPSLIRNDISINLSKTEALHYLRGETFKISCDKGFQLLSYQNLNLGWVKNLGSRFNNSYPKDWRIRMSLN